MRQLQTTLLALQGFHVVFLWLHDWIPLGRLNDLAAIRNQDSLRHRIIVTLMQSVPWTLGLIFSAPYLGQAYPGWIRFWLWISYAILFVGELRAWWIPYFFRPDAAHAARYQIIFSRTHSFLPPRNGIVPNTLHVMLHVSTFTTLLVLAILK